MDRTRYLIFPPLLPNGGLVLCLGLEWLRPLGHAPEWIPPALRWPLAAACLLAGGTGFVGSHRAMRRAQTNVDPRKPALRLVATWPYTRSRNPMYLGASLLFLGVGLTFHVYWMLLFAPFLHALLHFGVVRREEEYLERKFGRSYLEYKASVRRWF